MARIICDLTPSDDFIRGVVQQRLNYVEAKLGFEEGGLVQIDDAAYKAVFGLVKGNLRSALNIVGKALSTKKQLDEKRPYLITEEDIKRVCETYDPVNERTTIINLERYDER
jgi:replication-associated recombination protein RarA